VNGSPGDVKTDTVTASGRDVISDCTSTGNNDVSAQGSATVTVVAGSDYGDAEHPINNRYPTLLANTGASHVLGSSVYLGACVDGEDDGQPTTDADGDDTNVGSPVFGTCGGNDDEDGVTFTTLLVPGATADVDVTAHAACTLSAWIDFNLDGDWADPGEELFPGGQALTAGANSLSFSVPSDALIGTTYARFRCTTDGAVEPNGQASDGEVEDYLVTIETISDLGDAPDPKYPTLLASTGARHGLGSDVYLGACVDAEDNGQPTAGADGDDTNVGSPVFGTCVGDDDEDGVTFTTCLRIGAGANVDVLAHAACTLSAWIDFNGDGDWLDAGEDLFPSGQALAGGVNGLSFAVPADAVASTTYARFRCTTDGKVPFTGRASDGEVEDYQVIVKDPTLCPADLDGNCWVNTADLSILISQWGECQGCSADLNDNGWVNTADLSILLSQWGECP
jgi:hypothetical protein